jgi:hypothetical protein|tara:strand:- start:545 stop:928 length:384 start_codon:yes stop_codon:yes gene_type:complete
MKVSSLYIIFLLFFIGCESSKIEVANIDFDKLEAPPPPPLVSPPNPPPSFTPIMGKLNEVQINEVPHPFNLNGHIPCVVWVNGKQLTITPREAQNLANAVNLESRERIGTAQLNSGEGWLKPLTIIK